MPFASPTSVLFVHGFLDGAAAWSESIAALRPGIEARAVDLAGMGARVAEAGPYSLERFAQDVARELEAQDGPVVLVGHSMGAQVVELVAARHPARVRALVLVTPVPLAGVNLPDEVLATFRSLGGRPGAQRELRRHLSVSLSEDRLERLAALGDGARPEVVAAFVDAWSQGHADGTQHTKYCGPVLILIGEGDSFVNAEMLNAGVFPRFDKPVTTLVTAGHWPQVEQPQCFANALGEFLRSLETEGVPQEGWTRAFEDKSADSFAKAFAPEVVLEASVMTRPVVGLEQVKAVMAAASTIYEALAFTHKSSDGPRTYMEWEAKAFGGQALRGITILTKNTQGQIVHAAIHHRPLAAALAFSAELGRRVGDQLAPGHFHVAA